MYKLRKISVTNSALVFCGLFLVGSPFFLFAQNTTQDGLASDNARALTMTITPPLFQLGLNPGEEWKSYIKVVNNNSYPITVYGEPINFRSTDEGGGASLVPVSNSLIHPEIYAYSLASWLEISKAPFYIAPEQTVLVPFSIKVPPGASPGGHYGAILIGTEPPARTPGVSSVSVSSKLTSLIFVRVAGDVVEKGDIREFSTEKRLYQKTEVPFTIRFENSGNTHLLPQGDITVYNMLGRESGRVSVNDGVGYGTVLPATTRKFVFTWKGSGSIFEIGRYTAVATLAYGDEEKRSAERTISFWVIPFGPVVEIILGIVALILIFVWGLRRYVRGLLLKEAGHLHERPDQRSITFPADTNVSTKKIVNLRKKK